MKTLRETYKELFALSRALESFVLELPRGKDTDAFESILADKRKELKQLDREIKQMEIQREKQFVRDHLQIVHYTK